MSYFVYLKDNKKNEKLEKLFKIAGYFKNNDDILFDNRTIYPRFKNTEKRGNRALLEIFENMEDTDLEDLNHYVRIARRNDLLFMGNYLQLSNIKYLKLLFKDDEDSVYMGEEPYNTPTINIEEEREDRLEIIKDIIKDEQYDKEELKELMLHILSLI